MRETRDPRDRARPEHANRTMEYDVTTRHDDENAIPEYAKYADKPKRKGTPPTDLGLAQRTLNADSIDAIEHGAC